MAAGFDPALGGGVMYTNPPEVDRELAALRARVAEAERLLRLAYGGVGTLRRMSAGDSPEYASYDKWQREAVEWLGPSAGVGQ